MQIVRSTLLKNYNNIIFGISTKIGLNRNAPFYFNMSLTVGDKPEIVWENRTAFAKELGLGIEQIAFQKQIHSDIITIIDKPGTIENSDAMITAKEVIGLAISTADCTPIFIYDFHNRVIAAVHSGWRGTQKKILAKTLIKLKNDYNSKPDDLIVFAGPSISQKNYKVGEEVASLFDSKYVITESNKFYLNVLSANVDMLFDFGISKSNIEISPLCSYGDKFFHSFRRDGEKSGRALGIIAIREK
jgi:YfiH family protein